MGVKSLLKMEKSKPLYKGEFIAGPTIKAKWEEERLSTDEKPTKDHDKIDAWKSVRRWSSPRVTAENPVTSRSHIRERTPNHLPPKIRITIVKDPTLVRAVQFASLNLLDSLIQNQKAEYQTKMYTSIELINFQASSARKVEAMPFHLRARGFGLPLRQKRNSIF